jgi:nucleoside-diphosphate-sugar epimerase
MKVFVLGGEGFVGSAMCRYCQGRQIDFLSLTKSNYRNFTKESCDVLINANGNSKKYLAEEQPFKDFELSILSLRDSLLEHRERAGLYVYVSSIDVYNDLGNPRNNAETANIIPEGLSFYGFHKYLAEQMIKKYMKKWLIIRMGGLVGQGLKKNAIYDIVTNRPLRVHPDSVYQYLDVDDAVHIVFEVIKKGLENSIFNLCGKGGITLREILRSSPKHSKRDVLSPSRRETYLVNIEKIQSLCHIPETKTTVMGFVNEHLPDLMS